MNIDVINLCMAKPTREHSSSLCYVFNDGVRPKNSIKSGIRSCHVSRGILIQEGSCGVTRNQISKESLAVKDHIRIFLIPRYTYME